MTWGRFALVLLALVLMTGCADRDAISVARWTFEGPDGAPADLVLPVHLDRRLPRTACRYTLRAVVAVPDGLRDAPLTLVFPHFAGHLSLLVDGVHAESLDGIEPSGYRTKGPHAWRIPASATRDGTLDLELDVEHTWTMSGWLDTVPRLTPALDGGGAFVAQRTFNDVTATGALCVALLSGYLYIIVFLTDRRRRDYGWFAVTGLAGFGYPLFQSALLAPYLGRHEPLLAGLGVTSAVMAEMYFLSSRFQLPRPSRAWVVAFVLAIAAEIATAGYFETKLGGLAVAVVLLPTLAAVTRLFVRLALRKPRPPDFFLVLGAWPFMLLATVPDLAAWVGAGELLGGWRPACLGILFVGLMQTAAMSRAHTKSLRVADDLNAELRRQIEARSRELTEAIARLATEDDEVPLEAGEVVEGRYKVVRPLGEGGGGAVYLVERVSDREPLAMKVVHGGDDAHRLARLAREAELVAQIKHEHVVAIVDVGVDASGFLYIVMEYLPGATLKEHKDKFGRLDWVLPVLAQIADGLGAIHARGIVHRDLKPSNLLVLARDDGRPPLVKIADFGIARGEDSSRITTRPPPGPDGAPPRTSAKKRPEAGERTKRETDRLTQTGAILGTPFYMAPEAIDGARNVTFAVDLFAFGIIAYEWLTGRATFEESAAFAQTEGVVAAPPPVGSVRADLPADVGRLVDRCLAFDPEKRPTAGEAYEVLSLYMGSLRQVRSTERRFA